MRLRNKKTGEIVEICKICPEPYEARDFDCNSLAELNEEWEDCKEPKEYWFIDFNGEIKEFEMLGFEWQGWMKEIGNYFDTREEAELAVRKLKAWKRLKDKGFRFIGVRGIGKVIDFDMPKTFHQVAFDKNNANEDELEFYNDLMLLFGGEE